jgi:NADPH-dependent 2,4-dienoyl-CoA reductase/sulfur reductase-like enzyme
MMVSELGNYGTVKVEEVAVITMKRTNYNRLPSADVAIVGAGPIGLELTAALKRAGVDYLHFEAKQK